MSDVILCLLEKLGGLRGLAIYISLLAELLRDSGGLPLPAPFLKSSKGLVLNTLLLLVMQHLFLKQAVDNCLRKARYFLLPVAL